MVESHCEITELSLAEATLQMELFDVLVQSRQVTKLNMTNGAVRDEADGSEAQTFPPISQLLM